MPARYPVCSVLCSILAFPAMGVAAEVTNVAIITRTGDATPGGAAVLWDFHSSTTTFSPLVNSGGDVLFLGETQPPSGQYTGTKVMLLYRNGVMTQIARAKDPAPGSGNFTQFHAPTLNDAGDVAFYAGITAPTADTAGNGLFLHRNAVTSAVVRQYEDAPDGDGYHYSLGNPELADNGDVLFYSYTRAAQIGRDRGVYRHDGQTTATLVRGGDSSPVPGTDFGSISSFSINASDDLAILAQAARGGNHGIFLREGTTFSTIAYEGDNSPDGNGRIDHYNGVSWPLLNDHGAIAFRGEFIESAQGGADDSALMLYTPTGGLVVAAREGQPVPGTNQTLGEVRNEISINNAGHVLFWDLDAAYRTVATESAISFEQVVRIGDALADRDATIVQIARPIMNEQGAVVFTGGSIDDDGTRSGLYHWDDVNGLTTILQTGDSFDGSTIVGFTLETGGYTNRTVTGFSDAGHVTFTYRLADGTEGIAIWSSVTAIPEPMTVCSGLLGLMLLGGRRHRNAHALMP